MKLITTMLCGLGILILAPTTVFAQADGCNTTGCIGPADEIVEGLFPSPAGGIQVQSAMTTEASSCVGGGGAGNVITLPADHLNYRESYATLLTASVSGNRIQLRTVDNSDPCELLFTRMFN